MGERLLLDVVLLVVGVVLVALLGLRMSLRALGVVLLPENNLGAS